jgi:hypothetical protein
VIPVRSATEGQRSHVSDDGANPMISAQPQEAEITRIIKHFACGPMNESAAR